MNPKPESERGSADDMHRNDPRFVEYYARESATDRAAERAVGIMRVVLRARSMVGQSVVNLLVADVGCNAGTQGRCWLERGHRVAGVDISRDLVSLARERNARFGDRASFEVGTAARLPWQSGGFDVCLLPELLEHVEDWESCVREGVRVLRPGGTIYLSTTNVLCPLQQEFTLPGYSWYPAWLKRRVVRRAKTTHPQWANFASYPALHWFSPYRLKGFLQREQVTSLDRFDLIDLHGRPLSIRLLVRLVQSQPVLRLLAHMATSYTVLVGHKEVGVHRH